MCLNKKAEEFVAVSSYCLNVVTVQKERAHGQHSQSQVTGIVILILYQGVPTVPPIATN